MNLDELNTLIMDYGNLAFELGEHPDAGAEDYTVLMGKAREAKQKLVDFILQNQPTT